MLETEDRPTGQDPPTGGDRSPGRWLLVAAVAALVAVAGTLLVTAGGDDPHQPMDSVTSTPTTESGEPPASLGDFGTQLDAILKDVPYAGFPPGYDYAFNGPCAGSGSLDWGKDAMGGGDGGMGRAGFGLLSFATEAQASDAAARLVENLDSCTVTEWRTQPIAGTGAVLASSPDAVTWIQRTGDTVDVLQVPTTGGPPPVGVQVEVAELMVAYRTWMENNHKPDG